MDGYSRLQIALKKPSGIGGAIGLLWWQTMSNLYQTDIDNFITSEVCPHYTRFVDDEVLVTCDKERVIGYLPTLRQKYAEIGIELHPRKFYCQPYYRGVEYLGYHLKPNRIYLNNRIIKRAVESIDKPCNTDTLLCRANSYLGLMKAAHEYKNAVRYMNLLEGKGVYCNYAKTKVERPNTTMPPLTKGEKALIREANIYLKMLS